MNETVSIMRGGKPIGSAHITREGLYLRIACVCHLEQAELIRLHVRSDAGERPLGVLVPNGDAWELSTRIAAKYLVGEIEIFVPQEKADHAQEDAPQEKFVPIVAGEPFACLDAVSDAVLAEQDGQVGICVDANAQEEEVASVEPLPEDAQSMESESPMGQ